MTYIHRIIENKLAEYVAKGQSVLLLGPRQTGKTTLTKRFKAALSVSLIQPRSRQSYERDPSILADEVEAIANNSQELPLVIIDEVQKVPLIMDVVQDLIDRKLAKFILTGSSARKLRRGDNINLLPGRVIVMHLDPFSFPEIQHRSSTLEDLLIYGSIPIIYLNPSLSDKENILDSYISTYLEEEIRAEAVVRKIANFSKFLILAASESGKIVNYTKLSQEIGISHSTIANYYEILEDCLIAERIEPITKSTTRKKLSKAQKYIFFDLGVRRVAANEGIQLPLEYMGHLFEQFVALELIRKIRSLNERIKIHYWRDPDGPEVDWIINKSNNLIPLEVKWTAMPQARDVKNLTIFLKEYQNAQIGYIICRVPRKQKIAHHIYALPWQEIGELI